MQPLPALPLSRLLTP